VKRLTRFFFWSIRFFSSGRIFCEFCNCYEIDDMNQNGLNKQAISLKYVAKLFCTQMHDYSFVNYSNFYLTSLILNLLMTLINRHSLIKLNIKGLLKIYSQLHNYLMNEADRKRRMVVDIFALASGHYAAFLTGLSL